LPIAFSHWPWADLHRRSPSVRIAIRGNATPLVPVKSPSCQHTTRGIRRPTGPPGPLPKRKQARPPRRLTDWSSVALSHLPRRRSAPPRDDAPPSLPLRSCAPAPWDEARLPRPRAKVLCQQRLYAKTTPRRSSRRLHDASLPPITSLRHASSTLDKHGGTSLCSDQQRGQVKIVFCQFEH